MTTITEHPFSTITMEQGDTQYMVSSHRNVKELLKDNTIDVETLVEIATTLFTQGRCHVYAFTLLQQHPEYDLRISYRTAPDNEWEGRHFDEDEVNIHHVYVVNPATGEAIDAYGIHQDEMALLTFDGSYLHNLDVVDANMDDIVSHMLAGELLPAGNATIELSHLLAEKTSTVKV